MLYMLLKMRKEGPEGTGEEQGYPSTPETSALKPVIALRIPGCIELILNQERR